MTHEQKPESAEFRTTEEHALALRHIIDETRVPDRLPVALAHVRTAEARGAAEQRRKDAEGAEAVRQYQTSDWRWEDAVNDKTWEMAIAADAKRRVLYTRPANVAALEARVKELERENERRVAEVAAAEREKIAGKLDEVAKHLARPWGSYLTEEGIAVKEACAARVEQEATAIREGGEHG